MQMNQKYVPELKLKNVFFYVLYRWRSILLIALACTIVAGGLKYLSERKAADTPVVIEKTEEEIQAELEEQEEEEKAAFKAKARERMRQTAISRDEETDEDKEPELSLINQYRVDQWYSLNDYLEKSVYMQLDAKHVWVAEKIWLVKPEDEKMNADSILPAYSVPLAGLDDNQLKEVFGTALYAEELVKDDINYDSDTVTVRVYADKREDAEQWMAFVTGKMEEIAERSQAISKHELMLISDNIVYGPDADLEKDQADLMDSMTYAETRVYNIMDQLEGYLVEYYKKQEAKEEEKKAVTTVGGVSVNMGNIVKRAILGFIIGVILAAGLYAILYAVNGKLKDADEMTARYGLPLLGDFGRTGARHPGKGLDGLIEKWEYRSRRPKAEAVYERLASYAEGREDVQTVALVSTLPEAELKDLQAELAKRLPEKTVETAADFTRSGTGITQAAKADAVMWVEEKNISCRMEMAQTAEALMAGKADVIGAVLR